MRIHLAYQQNRQTTLPRVDVILTVYDGVVERLEKAQRVDGSAAAALIAEAKLLVSGLIVGVHSEGETVGANFVRLYDFILHCLDQGPGKIPDALDVLHILRESFQTVRGQALELERNGLIPPLERRHTMQAVV